MRKLVIRALGIAAPAAVLAACSAAESNDLVAGVSPAEADALNEAAARIDAIKPAPPLSAGEPLPADEQTR